jgi:hypothetical protein
MIQARAWPVRVMYILIAAALAIGLFITAAPAQKVSGANGDVKAEWTRSDTPTTEGWVLAPESTIVDYALASAGDVAYAIIYGYDEDYANEGYYLLKSDDGAATWTDLTDKLDDVIDPDDENYNYIDELVLVATDWEDPDFVAVAAWWWDNDDAAYYLNVLISTDGGDTFIDTGEVEDGGVYFDEPNDVSDLVVSYEVDGERDIAIGGMDNSGYSALFRCTVTGDNPGDWEDATDWSGDYPGWDDNNNLLGLGYVSYLVTDLIISPNWETDRTILAVTATGYGAGPAGYQYAAIHLQTGVWGKTSAAWNADAGLAPAVSIIEDVYIPFWLTTFDARAIAGVTLPLDYSGTDTDTRVCWVWVNYFDGSNSVGEILRVRDDAVDSVDTQIMDMPWLTNVSYLGTIAEGKAIAGVLADSADYPLGTGDLMKEPCQGVQVYRNAGITNMEICCLEWDKACKPPTGVFAMAVSYVSEDKAYAVALGGVFDYEEGAWSVSFDDGDTWNQLSLVDTYIDYLSDVAVSPDCNKMFLVSVNVESGAGCDSVWVYANEFPEAGYSEYSGHWLRTWCGSLEGSWFEASEGGLLRLAPDETTGDTVYLVDIGSDDIYYNDLETLSCWDHGTSTIDEIMDLAVADEATIYALGNDGYVAMSDDHGKTLTWTDPVDSELDTFGWSIAVHSNNVTHVLVGGQDGEVSYSDDGGETFTALEDVTDMECHVTVAFDTYFDENDVVYAALEGWGNDGWAYSQGGIYSFVIGSDDEEWTDLGADHDYAYTGIVLSFDATGNPFTSPETGGVLYASYVYWDEYDNEEGTGVARSLTPITEEAVCESCPSEWDYLTESDPEGEFFGYYNEDSVGFEAIPDALKMCGCLDASSNTKLFAIDEWWDYDMIAHEDGAVWTFEDCYAKKAVELTSPIEGFVVPTSACGCCNVPFTIKWERLCDACCYEIEFAYDADFADIYTPIPTGDLVQLDGLDFGHYCPGSVLSPAAAANPSAFLGCYFTPETTYYWRVRTVEAGTGQQIHSWWSEPLTFTVSPTAAAAAIELVAPVPGALNVPPKNLGFSWHMLATADAFDWVLSKNADLSAPVQSKTGLTGTATTYAGTLDYGTTYYWQVTAYNNGAAISASSVGTFTTAATGAFCSAIDGLCFATQAELVAHNAEVSGHPAPTPFWVWVVIAIGAVLVIVVIVLIFRTRRV